MKMLLIDGNSVLFRGFYATASNNMMRTKDGTYTNAVFAFANMLNKAVTMIHPEYLVVAFDKAKHNFRHELSKDYKANRKPAPVELGPQFALVREYLNAYHVPYLEYDEYEGDDIIGTISKKYPNVDVCILTSDKDMLQLLDETTEVYFMNKGLSDLAVIRLDNISKIWDVKPEQIADLKALMGDNSDNIKGVTKVGPKTGVDLIKRYGNLEGVYEHIDELKGKLKENLINDKEEAFLGRTLATIKTDLKIDHVLDDFKIDLDGAGANRFYEKYEMRSLIRNHDVSIKSSAKYGRVSKISNELLKDGTFIYMDTDEFSYYKARIYGIVFASKELVEYIPYEDLIQDTEALDYLQGEKKKIVYGLKHILHAFDYRKLKIAGHIDDMMLMSFLKNNYNDSIGALLESYGLSRSIDLQDIYGTIKKPKAIDTMLQTKRACEIASGLVAIYDDLKKGLIADDLYHLYDEVELPLTYVLYDMEVNGISCDAEVLNMQAQDIRRRMEAKAKIIYEEAGHEFNINSPMQLATVLFDELGLPANKKRSTNVEELEKLELYHPIIHHLMDYRKDMKLYSTYFEGLQKYISDDGKIHTIFSQALTQTGRLSSSEPNLQNISVRDEEGKIVRKAFHASDGHTLLSSDYSQIELRVLSALAKEKRMQDAFSAGIDIHTKTAMDIFDLSKDEVDDHLRRKAKAINFGVIYGISDFGLAKQASVSLMEARDFISDYFKTYPNIKAFLDASIDECIAKGYVTTILGRRRYIKEIYSSDHRLKEFAKRAAMNSKVQGSAADLIKVAMVKIHQKMQEKKLRSKMVLQIHDELIFDVADDEREIMQELVHDGMISALSLDVKLDVSMSFGYTWYEAK